MGQFFAVTYVFIFLGDSISRRIAIYMSTPSLRRRLAHLGVAMALIGIGLYLESLAIAIVIPVGDLPRVLGKWYHLWSDS